MLKTYSLESLLRSVVSAEQYKRILRVAIINLQHKRLHHDESKDELESFWISIEEFAKENPEHACNLTAVQIETVQKMTTPNDPYITSSMFGIQDFLEKILCQLDSISKLTGLEDSRSFDVTEMVWNFISDCSVELIRKYKSYLLQIVDAFCESPSLLRLLVLTESLVVQIFRKCFTEEKKVLIFRLMSKLFPRIQFDEEGEDLDAEIRKRFFHCLKSYSESIPEYFSRDDPMEALFARKIFSFIVRLYIVLVEHGDIEDFERFFETTKSKLEHSELIYTIKVNIPAISS